MKLDLFLIQQLNTTKIMCYQVQTKLRNKELNKKNNKEEYNLYKNIVNSIDNLFNKYNMQKEKE